MAKTGYTRKKRVNLKPIQDRATRHAAQLRDLRLRIIVLESMMKTIAQSADRE